MNTTAIYALTDDTELSTLMDIEQAGKDEVTDQGYKVIDAYTFFALPEMTSVLPSYAIMQAIVTGSSVAVVMVEYETQDVVEE